MGCALDAVIPAVPHASGLWSGAAKLALRIGRTRVGLVSQHTRLAWQKVARRSVDNFKFGGQNNVHGCKNAKSWTIAAVGQGAARRYRVFVGIYLRLVCTGLLDTSTCLSLALKPQVPPGRRTFASLATCQSFLSLFHRRLNRRHVDAAALFPA